MCPYLHVRPATNLCGVGTLTIDNVQSGDAGDYRCELQSRLYGTTLSEEIATVTVFDGEKLSIVV